MSDIAQLISQANAAAVANFQAAQLAKPFATYSLVQSEDLGAGVKYVLKSDGAGWLMIRKNYSDSGATLVYASSANNLMIGLAEAWGLRDALTYGSILDAQ